MGMRLSRALNVWLQFKLFFQTMGHTYVIFLFKNNYLMFFNSIQIDKTMFETIKQVKNHRGHMYFSKAFPLWVFWLEFPAKKL